MDTVCVSVNQVSFDEDPPKHLNSFLLKKRQIWKNNEKLFIKNILHSDVDIFFLSLV